MKLFKKSHYNKLLGIKEESELEPIEELVMKNMANFGEPKDLFHPDYGWILKDGKITEAGILFCKKHYPGS